MVMQIINENALRRPDADKIPLQGSLGYADPSFQPKHQPNRKQNKICVCDEDGFQEKHSLISQPFTILKSLPQKLTCNLLMTTKRESPIIGLPPATHHTFHHNLQSGDRTPATNTPVPATESSSSSF